MNQLSFDWLDNFVDTGIKVNKLGKFKIKVCCKCKIEYEATQENFSHSLTNKDKLSSWCRACNSRDSLKKQKERKEKGTCQVCYNIAVNGSVYCEYHSVYYKIKTQKQHGRFKQINTTEELRTFINALLCKLKDQNYKCAITGIDIALGINASLDHIQEVTNGGSCALENLQWVTKNANSRKRRKHKEFDIDNQQQIIFT